MIGLCYIHIWHGSVPKTGRAKQMNRYKTAVHCPIVLLHWEDLSIVEIHLHQSQDGGHRFPVRNGEIAITRCGFPNVAQVW